MHTGRDSARGRPVPGEAARTPGSPPCGEPPDVMGRRGVLSATVVAGLTAASATSLAACGRSKSPQNVSHDPGTALARTDDIPLDGGKIFPDQHVVVTQPAAGQYKGFSSVCTHKGCAVSQVANGRIICPCHGSEYSITDGSVQTGPAPRPLPHVAIKVKDGEISVA
jgi:Rieske Fe-S protein